ncbi:hypothetical protein K8352_03795 [Flavobacteriaceae bacterium F89]|uniref:Uncharacterized protein n=1 Tax=Cerina litoralis TaxID=2874477 RepID=A0AAE3ETE2_9FLAO|nr:hypothetical protein [Cerina litoralis]MCG2459859.1 hypothetical protein [Cerina litoralis]
MRIQYKTVKKIHLYACLATAALLLMFIFTSYFMIYHDQFDHDSVNKTELFNFNSSSVSDQDLQNWADEHHVPGRLVKSYSNPASDPVLEYANAKVDTRITFLTGTDQIEVTSTTKGKVDAFVRIHRNMGYGGGFSYNIYAFLLDVLGASLILFTITGIFMWMRLLKNNKWAWIIFLGGLAYFGSVLLYLTFV